MDLDAIHASDRRGHALDEDDEESLPVPLPPGAPPVELEHVRLAAAFVLQAEGRAGAGLSVTVVDDPAIAELHARYLGVSGATDVISFPLDDDFPGEALVGEVVVSADTAEREAGERGLPFAEELLRYVVHGTLHLLGYDDQDPDDHRRMHARQEELLAQLLSRLGDGSGGSAPR